MKHLALIFIFLAQTVWSEPSVLTEPTDQSQEQASVDAVDPQSSVDELFSTSPQESNTPLVLSHTKTPQNLYIGEIFPLTIKLTPVDIASGDIEYTLQGEEGLQIFSQTPSRTVKEDGVYDTFYFLVQSSSVRLPDINAVITATAQTSETLIGTHLNTSTLNPPSTYANVLADSFKVVAYKTTAYNQESNIVVFTVKATRCNIATFSLKNAIKQGFESKKPNVNESTMTYYAVIPNGEQALEFTIFNLRKNRYESISIPIVVDDDTVSTQTDISPTDSRHTELKVGASAIFATIFIALFYWRRSKWYLYLSVLPLFYVIFALLPNSNVCVKNNSPIYLLPIKNGTIFEMTTQEEKLEVENHVGEFTKVRIKDNTLGWVHESDICSN